ncbi:MAG: hypothetical protein A2075_12215 [Geobacteraceae bacterium GWC2_58_44]|nr:MAG: hypothetical protein A2075_12215 [Geobacteraceae bacterium GWC2_58_44]HBG06327.1 hypothetical protein [Geobacter sp.]
MLDALISLRSLLSRRLSGMSVGIRYTIGGRVYTQRPLVLLQMEQLVEFINPEMFSGLQTVNALGVVKLLGDRIAAILAIVLTPRGVEVDQKDMAEITAHLRAHVDLDTAARVVEGFLSCNPVASVFNRLTGLLKTGGVLATVATGSLSSSASSQQAT